jgi:hypothetical protein
MMADGSDRGRRARETPVTTILGQELERVTGGLFEGLFRDDCARPAAHPPRLPEPGTFDRAWYDATGQLPGARHRKAPVRRTPVNSICR